jgi:AcrR family transcriptional regulator
MARPVTVSTENIVSAAREEFLEKGYEETTTLAIALRAGVSEGSLFKRFPGKAQLFCAAMDLPPLELPRTLEQQVGQGELRENLRQIALELIGFIEQVLPKAIMMWSNRAKPVVPPPGSPPLEILRALTAYFTAEIKLGRVADGDPQIMARVLQGACWSYCFLQLITENIPKLPREEYVDRLIAQLWTGLSPEARRADAPSRRRPPATPTRSPARGSRSRAPSPRGSSR